jgi:hypothetical protein
MVSPQVPEDFVQSIDIPSKRKAITAITFFNSRNITKKKVICELIFCQFYCGLALKG